MATDSWINETLYPDWGQRFRVKRELARVQSAFQDVAIFANQLESLVAEMDREHAHLLRTQEALPSELHRDPARQDVGELGRQTPDERKGVGGVDPQRRREQVEVEARALRFHALRGYCGPRVPTPPTRMVCGREVRERSR